jgi:hypothetical protein
VRTSVSHLNIFTSYELVLVTIHQHQGPSHTLHTWSPAQVTHLKIGTTQSPIEKNVAVDLMRTSAVATSNTAKANIAFVTMAAIECICPCQGDSSFRLMRTFLKLTVDCVIFHAAHLLALRCSLSTSAVLVLQQTTDTTVSVALEFGGRLSSTACMWSAWVDYLVQPLHVQIVDACGGVYSNAHSRVRAMCACMASHARCVAFGVPSLRQSPMRRHKLARAQNTL